MIGILQASPRVLTSVSIRFGMPNVKTIVDGGGSAALDAPAGEWAFRRRTSWRCGLPSRRAGISLLALVAAMLAGRPAAADGASSTIADPDTESARRHFQRGAELYDRGAYAEAVREFETAKRIKPAPAFEYNVARCRDRLEQWGAAADGYERYLVAVPNAPERDELRARIVELRARAGGAPPASAMAAASADEAPTPITRRWWLWTLIGVVVVGAAIGIIAATSGGTVQNAAVPTTKDGNFTVSF